METLPRSSYTRRVEIIRARKDILHALKCASIQHPDFQPLYTQIKQNANRHYLSWSLDDPCQISYSRPGVHRHDYRKRTKTTLGRYIRRQLAFPCDDQDLDLFVRKTCAHVDVFFRFTTVRGEDIREAYRDKIGGHSCMTGDSADQKLDLYVHNTDKVSLLVYRDDRMTARALVWKTDDGATCMDRIYPNDGYHVEFFHAYAKNNGWLPRPDNRLPCRAIKFGGRIQEVTVRTWGVYPYLDSFQWTDDDPEDSKITLSTDCDLAYTFSDTGGSWNGGRECACCGYVIHGRGNNTVDGPVCDECEGDHYASCCECGNVHHTDNMTYAEDSFYCERCAGEYLTYCNKCDEYHTGESVHIEDRGEDWCDSCAEDNAEQCQNCCNWFADGLEHIRDTDEYRCTSCAEDCASICTRCGEWQSSELAHIEDIDEDWCDHCADKHAEQCQECDTWYADGITCDCAKECEESNAETADAC